MFAEAEVLTIWLPPIFEPLPAGASSLTFVQAVALRRRPRRATEPAKHPRISANPQGAQRYPCRDSCIERSANTHTDTAQGGSPADTTLL